MPTGLTPGPGQEGSRVGAARTQETWRRRVGQSFLGGVRLAMQSKHLQMPRKISRECEDPWGGRRRFSFSCLLYFLAPKGVIL